VRRLLVTALAAVLAASVLAVVPLAPQAAQGEGDPELHLSVTEGLTGTRIGVTGQGCYLTDGVTAADGLLFQLVNPDGTAAASATLAVERDGTWDRVFTVPVGVPAGTYSVVGTCIAPMFEDLGQVDGGTFTVTGEGDAPPARESTEAITSPRQIEPYPAYDGQSTCSPSPKPGMVSFKDMFLRAYPGSGSYGISRDCSVGGTSEHKEGRAWDWALDAGSAADRRIADAAIAWLLATDQYGHRHAMARRLGVMYIIWNRRIFKLYQPNEGWQPYSGSSPHTDHVHISLTRAGGARTTSFWSLGLPGPDGQGTRPPPAPVPRARFSVETRDIRPTYDHVETGDFDGDGRIDVLWFGNGPRPQEIWWGRRTEGFARAGFQLGGRAEPVVGDFDGDGRDDVLWYRTGSGSGTIWYGRGNRTWTTATITVPARFGDPYVGDFNGNGTSDIFWYGEGDAFDRLWFGRPDRKFAALSTSVSGVYQPATGDFDGDGRDDILWYAPGAADDFLWTGRTDRTFLSTDQSIGLFLAPIVGDFNGNGRDDIFWYAPGRTQDKVWFGRADRTFAKGRTSNVTGTFAPTIAGDLDGDDHTDLIWYRAGTPIDEVWMAQ